MFENILGHEKIISDLKTGAEKGRLPGAMLFYGEPYGGNLQRLLSWQGFFRVETEADGAADVSHAEGTDFWRATIFFS